MTSLTTLIKRYYRLIFGCIVLICITLSLVSSYVLYEIAFKNAMTLASLGDAVFKKIAKEVENKVDNSKYVFNHVEKMYRKNILKNSKEIEAYIREKYLEQYDVAIISEKGVIIETTNANEQNLDLTQFPDGKKSLNEAKKTGDLLIDYPVLNSDMKSFYVYLLKYIPEKRVFFQLGYKILFFSEIISSLNILDLKPDFHFDYSVFYVYLDKEFLKVRLFGEQETIDREMVEKLLNNPNKTVITKNFNELKLLSVISNNKGFALLYKLHIEPLTKAFIIGWSLLNLCVILLITILYKRFVIIVRRQIETPLKQIKSSLDDIKPYQYVGDIVELKELSEAYDYHLERTKTRDFIKEVLMAQERERERIARDVHDSVIQNLNYILIMLQQKKEIELVEILKSQIQELRKLVIDGDIVMLKSLGLKGFFEAFINECASRNPHIKFYFKDDFSDFDSISKDVQIHIVRIVRELITNAVKHAKCKMIELRLYNVDNTLCISIDDDGVGFDVDNINLQTHFGLISVKERVFILGGKINIKSDKNGTKVLVQLPI